MKTTIEFNTCECGNKVSTRDILPENFECCEWCTPEMRFDGIMWRKAIGADWLEQMETHGLDSMYSVEINGETFSVFANSLEIAEYIALEHTSILKRLDDES